MPLFLGLDCSTQSLTAMVLDIGDRGEIVFEHALDFDREFPEYGTDHGVVRGAGPLEVSAPPLLWAAALDRMMAIVSREGGFDLRDLTAISGSGQQHGSVYLNAQADAAIARLDPRRSLVAALDGVFSRPDAPVWMDESTRAQCDAIDAALGGPGGTARLTGSAATERFTGPQIRKFAERHPDAYARTNRIHLVSSYLASLLAGRHMAIDHGDGSGMNLMDIEALAWAQPALEATASGLRAKLPHLTPPSTIGGTLAPYWRERYGFPAAAVVSWSGDNPCSLAGMGIVTEGLLGVSLGTSDTVFGFSAALPSRELATHIFRATTGGYMGLVCFRNGSLAREAVRDAHGLDWTGFSAALRATPAGNGGGLMLPWFEPEITPRVATPGIARIDLDPADAAANVRAVVEGQMMAMANHSAALAGGHRIRIVATGGASANREILQVMADVFDAEVCQATEGNAACLGAALRAWQAFELSQGRDMAWSDIVAGLTDPSPTSRVAPIADHARLYRDLRGRYDQIEAAATSARRR